MKVSAVCETSVDGIFCAGDMADGPSLVVQALESGLVTARAVDTYLNK